MLLTVVVPSFNQGRFIKRTLDSIFAQDYRPIEVIVVDGASSDDTTDILRCYAERHPELQWISEADRGPADAVNKGLAKATGEITAIQSSDDIYYPGAFDTAMRVFHGDPDCGFVIGDCTGISADDRLLFTTRLPDFSWEAYLAMSLNIPQSSIFFRTSLARAIGGWNVRQYSPDIEFWLRLLLRTRAVHVDQVLSAWRIYPGQRTHSPEARKRIWREYWQMVEELPDLRASSIRVRRLARASAHLLALRFHPTADRSTVRRHLILGFLQHPTFWRHYPWPIRPWLPGAARLEQLKARMLQWLRG